jgi:hypothetical protein
MTMIQVNYHNEDGNWWGDVPGWRWSCAAPTLKGCRRMAREGLEWMYGKDWTARPALFVHWSPSPYIKFVAEAHETFVLVQER